MKKRNLSRMILSAAVLSFAFSSFSCNRGYGCPTNFSLDALKDVVVSVLTFLF